MSSTENIVEKRDDVEEDKKKTSFHLKQLTPGVVLAVITGYFAWATYYYIDKTNEQLGDTCCNGYGFLMILFIFTAYGFFYSYLFIPFLARSFRDVVWKPFRGTIANLFKKPIAIWIAYAVIFAAMVVYLVLDAWNDKQRLIPMAGLAFFLLFGFIFSKDRRKINWHIILRGIILQFLFGLITLRWETGQNIFKCAGDKVTTFLGYAKNGSAFVYGNMLVMDEDTKVFAFEAISTIYFLAFVINILYHIGVMQKIVINLGLFLHYVMGTSICESVNSAANIFLGQTEAPLLLKPYLPSLTSSEIHTVMTSGFASVSGTVLAAYISYGAKASHLITASVMAAPAGLLFSKMMLPETEKTTQAKELVELAKSEYVSVLDAASKGASDATYIILGIIANLIAFIASVFFINGVLSWLGMLVGFTSPEETWSIELIMGYVFTPISFLMGVPWEECQDVGKLIGLKTMVNEFAAFQQFKTLDLSPRTRIIATFAICGFANPGSIGIMISALGTLIPNKNEIVTANVFRAFVSGSVVCFTTACIAGMLSTVEQMS